MLVLTQIQRYDWFFLRTLASLGYTGWAAYAATHVLTGGATSPDLSENISFGFLAILFGVVGLLVAQSSPWTYYVYVAFPRFFWHSVVQRGWKYVRDWKNGGAKAGSVRGGLKTAGWILLSIGALQGMVVSS